MARLTTRNVALTIVMSSSSPDRRTEGQQERWRRSGDAALDGRLGRRPDVTGLCCGGASGPLRNALEPGPTLHGL